MVARPKNYQIEGETVDIIFRAVLKRFKEGYPTAGRHTSEGVRTRAFIEVAPGQTWEEERSTVLHEVLHDAAARSGVRGFMKMTDEELFVTSIEPWLFRIFQENPELVAWMLEPRP